MNEHINYSALIENLSKASLFDLWRINAAISNLLDDPDRINAIKATLHIGQTVQYFDVDTNRDITARILEINRTRVFVINEIDQKRWNIPFYMLNLQNIDTTIQSRTAKKKLDRNLLKVGDNVGYRSRSGRDMYGTIVTLNPKTAIVKLPSGERWRVYYSHLFLVLEGESTENPDMRLLEGEVESVIYES